MSQIMKNCENSCFTNISVDSWSSSNHENWVERNGNKQNLPKKIVKMSENVENYRILPNMWIWWKSFNLSEISYIYPEFSKNRPNWMHTKWPVHSRSILKCHPKLRELKKLRNYLNFNVKFLKWSKTWSKLFKPEIPEDTRLSPNWPEPYVWAQMSSRIDNK